MPAVIHKIFLAVLAVILTGSAATATAQDYRILTEIRVLRPKEQPKTIATALSIFHVGQTYDRVTGENEVTIYQPALRQFTIFNAKRMLATRISFDKIAAAQQELDRFARNYISQLRKKGKPAALREAEAIQYQLTPQFREKYDAKHGVLSLTNDHVTYTARCISLKDKNPVIITEYIRYADWMARLNPLLHAEAMFPGPRLKVNAALRTRQLMPSIVERQDTPGELRLQAKHAIHWKLTKEDKRRIYDWERLLQRADMTWIPFEQFRETITGK